MVALRLNKHCRVFHILDSLASYYKCKREARQLQRILLKLFEGSTFMEDRIAINIAHVIYLAFYYPFINS
jgi:hypothetical protein